MTCDFDLNQFLNDLDFSLTLTIRSGNCDFMPWWWWWLNTWFDKNETDVIRANAVETEVAADLADNERSLVTLQICLAVKATFVHYNITWLTSASVRIVENWRSHWDCTVQQTKDWRWKQTHKAYQLMVQDSNMLQQNAILIYYIRPTVFWFMI